MAEKRFRASPGEAKVVLRKWQGQMISRPAMSGWFGGFDEPIAFYVVADGRPVWTSDSCIPDQA